MKPSPRLAVLLTALALALAAPAAALAQSPFTPLPPSQQPSTTVTRAPTNTSNAADSGGLKRWQEILIFLGGVALLGGISFAILADARRRAPVKDDEFGHAASGQGSHKHVEKARARKKTKAQRAARRKNRAAR